MRCIAVFVRELRSKIDDLLAKKLTDPSLDIGSTPVVQATIKLISGQGL